MDLFRLLLWRLVGSFLVVFAVVSIVFFISRVIGNPVSYLAPIDATPEDLIRIEEVYGLDEPIIEQYKDFLLDVAQLKMGDSFRTGQPAVEEVRSRIWKTVQLGLAALVFSLTLGVSAGVTAAIYRGSVVDIFVRLLALIGQAAPSFWLGLMLIFFFSVRLGWLPTGGRGGLDHMILPAITLGTAGAASIARLTRSALLDVLNSDFVTMARAKGLPRRTVIFKHALRNAMIPVVTILGLRIGALISGSVIVETIFAWPGVGRLIIQAINVSDFPVVQAAILLTASAVVFANLLTDIAYMFIDPRIRYVRT